jgi:hypothetical protein
MSEANLGSLFTAIAFPLSRSLRQRRTSLRLNESGLEKVSIVA